MFFRKPPNSQPKLIDVVTKKMDTGYVFWDISDDLGNSVEKIFKSTPLVVMSYAYSRRTAAAAQYIQGLFDADKFNYVESIFKELQKQTGHTVEFQEKAAADSLEFLQSYHHLISGNFVKKAIQIAKEYEIPSGQCSDADLFMDVIDTMHEEEMQERDCVTQTVLGDFQNMNEKIHENAQSEIAQTKNKNTELVDSVISELQDLSNRDTKKSVTLWVQPVGKPWSCEFHFSDEERNLANELCRKLQTLMNGMVQMTEFTYKEHR